MPSETRQRLTAQRINADPNLSGPTPIGLKWSPDGTRITYLKPKPDNDDVLDLWAYDVTAGRHAPLVRTEELVPPDQIQISEQEAARRERMRVRQTGIVQYQWSQSGDRLLFPLSGALYVYDLQAGASRPVRRLTDPQDGPAFDPKFSPQGTAVAFVRGGELYVVDVEAGGAQVGAPTRLTHDAGGAVQNGVAEYVAQEEMGRYTGYWWSPDGRYIAYTQIDEAQVPLVQRPAYYADRVEVVEQRYPAAGEANAVVRLGVVAARGPQAGQTVWMDVRAGEVDRPEAGYIARVNWLPDSTKVAVQVQSRDQKTLNLVFCTVSPGDAATGQARAILREEQAAWVELNDDLRFLKETEQFLWASERTGYKHLYLYDLEGNLVRPLTAGEWPVSKVSGVDEKGGWVYFEGWTKTPLERHLYRVPLEGGEVEQITRGSGWHQAVPSPDAARFIDTHSSLMQPPQVHLYAVGGERLTTLEPNELPERDKYLWLEPEFVTLQAEDSTPLFGRLTLPPDFDPRRQYPAIVKVYGGPHAQTVADAWDASLYGQLFAQQGYVVWELDNRGMGNRGKDFCAALYEHMGGVEVADQLVGVEYLKTLPYVDPARIGVFGWSYGGYMTLMCLCRAPNVFKAGVAVAPVTDWKLYDTHYTEHYMGHPAENEEGYRESSVLTHIGNLKGKLLLVHGMADDNVLFQNSVLLMEAMQRANIPFEMMAYPGKKHGIRGAAGRGEAVRVHLFEMILEFLGRSLF